MPKIIFGTTLLLFGFVAPTVAQPYRDAPPYGGAQTQRYGSADRIAHQPSAAKRKPRVCFRPDVGRYSRLIPYSC